MAQRCSAALADAGKREASIGNPAEVAETSADMEVEASSEQGVISAVKGKRPAAEMASSCAAADAAEKPAPAPYHRQPGRWHSLQPCTSSPEITEPNGESPMVVGPDGEYVYSAWAYEPSTSAVTPSTVEASLKAASATAADIPAGCSVAHAIDLGSVVIATPDPSNAVRNAIALEFPCGTMPGELSFQLHNSELVSSRFENGGRYTEDMVNVLVMDKLLKLPTSMREKIVFLPTQFSNLLSQRVVRFEEQLDLQAVEPDVVLSLWDQEMARFEEELRAHNVRHPLAKELERILTGVYDIDA